MTPRLEPPLALAPPPGEYPRARAKSQILSSVSVGQELDQLEVAMNDVSGVDVLETAKDLISKRPETSVGEWLLGSDLAGEFEHSVTQLADTERRIEPTMTCRSASISSSWKVRV